MVDPKSYELAEYFLADFAITPLAVAEYQAADAEIATKGLTIQLAQTIQDAIEDFLNAAERDGFIEEAA